MDLEVIRYVQQTLFRVYMSTKKEIRKLIGTTFTKSLKPARKNDIHILHCILSGNNYYDAHSVYLNIYNHLPVHH
jgi:hypothetical protein